MSVREGRKNLYNSRKRKSQKAKEVVKFSFLSIFRMVQGRGHSDTHGSLATGLTII